MSSYVRYILFFALNILFISCATIFTGTHAKIIIDSFPQDALVKINGESVGNTPVQVKVSRALFRKEIMEVSKEGYVAQRYNLKRIFNPLSALDLMFFPGIPIDVLTGAVSTFTPIYNNLPLSTPDSSDWNKYINEFDGTIHVWNKKIRLSWDFFQGNPKKLTTDKILKTGAVTYSSFLCYYNYNDSAVNLNAFAVFYPKKSWVIYKHKTGLNHEQGHFDISEIYSRKFKRKLMECSFTKNNIDSVIKNIDNDYNKKLIEAQTKYDNETGHGINEESQNTWNEMIRNELNENTNFEKPFYQIQLHKNK